MHACGFSIHHPAGTIRCDVFFLKTELEVVWTGLHVISFEPFEAVFVRTISQSV